ncbi:MAG TPA: DUF169 domain-containing protein [Desulfatiglandales bacterium]|nr:DUF169 domain-containing protein [Desulfatiglandales bacterium]
MDAATIKKILQDELGIKKEIIALKQVREEPAHLEAYQDKNNICYMMGEAIEERKTFYTTLKNHVCLLGCAATGLDPVLQNMSDEQREESQGYHVRAINIFPSEAIQAKAEKEADSLFPKFQEVYKAVIIGPFEDVPEPDVLIILGTAEQIHLLTRAYCYATGSIVQGFAGMGVCRMLIPYAILNREPTYTVSDRAWRNALRLSSDELTLVTPPDKLVIMLENLEESKK